MSEVGALPIWKLGAVPIVARYVACDFFGMSELTSAALCEQAQIAQLAYQIYEKDGRPEGCAAEHWARAERAIHEQRLPGPATAPLPDDGRPNQEVKISAN